MIAVLKYDFYAGFVTSGFSKNVIFDLTHRWNRDNCFYPYYLMKEKLKSHGIDINTGDVSVNGSSVFELHMDVQKKSACQSCYLLMLETELVCPANGVVSSYSRYRKIFTWNDELVDGNRFVKINFPNPIHIQSEDGFLPRDRFCCLISANKTLAVQDKRTLYRERVSVIRWFENNAPQDFDLYGVGWDLPVVARGLRGKFERGFWRSLSHFMNLRPFPSYRGKVAHKRDVLTRTRFAICFENVRDLPGYITEKIFDCFFSGCVPVYWGANNITEYIPAGCFIDRRNFNSTEDVYRFLKSISEDDFKEYQRCIAAFLESDAAYPFSSEFFAETIVNTIVQDLGPQA
jgi:hypothetical protein